ncbi:MAG: CARDB domain-containing protein, partial [Leptospirales bacterium]
QVTKGMISDQYNVVIPVVHGREKISVSFTFPVSQGVHYLSAIVDTSDVLSETVENNNVFGPVAISVGNGLSDDALEVSNAVENDTAANALAVDPDRYNQLVAIDEDWYLYTLEPGKTLQTAIYFVHASGDIDAFFYRYDEIISDYVLLKSSATATDNEALSYRNNSSESMDIFIRILPLEHANTYSMDIKNLTVGGYPDLIIASMVSYPINPVAGEIVRTTIAVENSGTAPTADTSYLDFYNTSGKPDFGQYGDLFQIIPSGLLPGEKVYINFEYKMEGGDYHLYAISDTDNIIEESVESNNIFGPNLIQVSPETNKNISAENMKVTVNGSNITVLLNIGGAYLAAGETFNIKLDMVDSLDNTTAKSVYEWDDIIYTHTLNNTGTASITYTLKADSYVPSGTYYLRVKLDSTNLVFEANELDNVKYSNSISTSNTGTPYWIETVEVTGPAEADTIVEADTIMEVYKYTGNALNRNPATVNSIDLELIRKSDNMVSHRSGAYLNLEAGSYFIRIYGKGESTGAYQIGVRGGYATQILPDASNGVLNESENSFTQATLLEPGEGRVEYISSTTDEDWYFVTVYAIDTYQVAAASNDTVKVELYRYESANWTGVSNVTKDQLRLIASQTDFGTFGSVRSMLGTGKYFIRVFSDPGFSPSYGIVFSETLMQRPYVYGTDGAMDLFENDTGIVYSKTILPGTAQFHTLFLQIEDESQPPVDGIIPLLKIDDEDWYFYEIQK